jgi:hypothetical protein
MKSPRPTAVPKPMQAIYDAVVALTDALCRDHLTGEYRDLARAMTASHHLILRSFIDAARRMSVKAVRHDNIEPRPRVLSLADTLLFDYVKSVDHGLGASNVGQASGPWNQIPNEIDASVRTDTYIQEVHLQAVMPVWLRDWQISPNDKKVASKP